jgi:hypothetical protein
MKKILVSAVAGSFLLFAGCGEKTQVTVYKQGQYQGKPDRQPWDNAQFKNDRAAWEKTIRARNVGQNEYVRIGGN